MIIIEKVIRSLVRLSSVKTSKFREHIGRSFSSTEPSERMNSPDADESVSLGVARELFLLGVSAVLPNTLVKEQVALIGSKLSLKKKYSVDLNEYEFLYVVGFGKAVLPMAEEVMTLLKNRVKRCVISVPEGSRTSSDDRIEIHRGAQNNIPDSKAEFGAKKIVEIVQSCSENDFLLILVSGGGSALLPLPRPPVTLQEKAELVKALSRAGANIVELNSVRKEMSLVKGGGLVGMCRAKEVYTLILSDVLGDRLDVIASGPTVPSPSTQVEGSALQILEKYIPLCSVSPNILECLKKSRPQVSQGRFNRAHNLVIGSNEIALKAIESRARTDFSGIPIILSSCLEGEARVVGDSLAQLSHFASRILHGRVEGSEAHLREAGRALGLDQAVTEALLSGIRRGKAEGVGLLILLGGETTVRVTGNGCGGRNQELALAAALSLHNLGSSENITILSGGTDGMDGPCDATGAVITPNTIAEANKAGLGGEDFLRRNDSHTFFSQLASGKYHVVTGHTGTNVMDIQLLLINSFIRRGILSSSNQDT